MDVHRKKLIYSIKLNKTFYGVLTSVKVDWTRCKAAVCPAHCGSSSPTPAGILSDHLKSEFYSYVEHHYICKNKKKIKNRNSPIVSDK